jgi:hypothetical protein
MSAISSRNKVPPCARPGQLAPLLHPEQFFLDPLRRHSRGADHDKRRFGAWTPDVQQPRGDFLADAGRAGDQHTAAGGGDPLQCRADGVDDRRTAGQLISAPDLGLERGILAPQPLRLGRAADQHQQPFRLERLFDEVGRSAPHSGDGGVEIPVA